MKTVRLIYNGDVVVPYGRECYVYRTIEACRRIGGRLLLSVIRLRDGQHLVVSESSLYTIELKTGDDAEIKNEQVLQARADESDPVGYCELMLDLFYGHLEVIDG